MKKTDKPVIVEQIFSVSKEKLWRSITDIDLMKQWYFDNILDFKPVVGFKTQFNVVSGERNFLHKWDVVEVVENEKIVYNWQYEDYKGSGDVSFELFEGNGFVRLEVKVIVLEDFPDDIPEFKRESCIGGWEYFLKERLKEYLDRK